MLEAIDCNRLVSAQPRASDVEGLWGLYRGSIWIIGYIYRGYIEIMENQMETTI